jgi:hypothetical protein
MTVRGGCLFGLVEFEVDLPFVKFVKCHCSRCRRATGAERCRLAARLMVGAQPFAETLSLSTRTDEGLVKGKIQITATVSCDETGQVRRSASLPFLDAVSMRRAYLAKGESCQVASRDSVSKKLDWLVPDGQQWRG